MSNIYDEVERVKRSIDKNVTGQVVAEHTKDEHFYRYKKTDAVYPSSTTILGTKSNPYLRDYAAKKTAEYIKDNWDRITEDNLDAILQQAREMYKHYRDAAGSVGTYAHNAIDEYVEYWIEKGDRPTDIRDYLPEEIDDSISRFLDVDAYSSIVAVTRSAEKFFDDFYIIPIASELKVACEKYEYAGTLDKLAYVGQIEGGRDECFHTLWQTSTRDATKMACGECGGELDFKLTVLDWKSSNSIDKTEYAMQPASYRYALWYMTEKEVKPERTWVVRFDKGKDKYEIAEVAHMPSAFKAFRDFRNAYEWLNNGEDKLNFINSREEIYLDI